MKDVLVNGKWNLSLPDHRAARTEWISNKGWERMRLDAIHDLVKPGMVVFDIGTEEGDMSALYQMWGATVVPFEPNPLVWPNIRAIWEGNKLATPPAYWVGFASDTTIKDPPQMEPIFSWPERDGWPACAYGEVIGDHGFRNVCERFHDTPQTSIDDFATEHNLWPDIITIDVEGAELVVLRGAVKALERDVTVFVSIHPDIMKQAYQHTKEQLISFMQELGYQDEFLETDHEEHWRFSKSAR